MQYRFLFFVLLAFGTASAQTDYYFAGKGTFDPAIPTPEQFLGYPVGSHYTRHDEIIAYFKELARVSPKIHVQIIGKTYEERPQLIATITSTENYSHLEAIRQEHATLVDPSKPLVSSGAPVVVLLGYSVHGNETSSGEVSMLTAYYLVASQSEETRKWLNEAVVFIDPSLNPDGRDRAANWYNSYKSWPPVADGNDKEHLEIWPGGRSNHYLNNLNRDWLSVTQVESKNRLEWFHQWYPNVQIDFHEQGANATYYFEPTPKSHQSPIIPQEMYDFNAVLAKYQAKALDDIGSLYFTKENYDNLSPIYGSTYPKFYGGVGATFEEASSGGIARETTNGILTFSFTIRNHLVTGLATVRGAVAEKAGLFKLQKDFFKSALEQAHANAAKAFVFGDSRDETLTARFLDLLLRHRVKVYELPESVTVDGKRFEKGKAFVVPSEQANFRIIHSLFEENLLKDSIFYDNTGWSVIHAYGLQYAKVVTPGFGKGELVTAVRAASGRVVGGVSSYAYLASWSEYNASGLLYELLRQGVLVKTSFKPFTANLSGGGTRAYSYGSLVIPVAGQSIGADSLYKVLQGVSGRFGIEIAGVGTGFNAAGIDLGSSNIRSVRKPEVAIAFGQGVNSEEAGQVWFLLNQHLGLPLVKIDVGAWGRASLRKYNTLVLVGGNYADWDKAVVGKIKEWVNDGGTLITFQGATAWAVRQEIAHAGLLEGLPFAGRGEVSAGGGGVSGPAGAGGRVEASAGGRAGVEAPRVGADTARVRRGDGGVERFDFARQQDVEGAKRINGAIFVSDLDITSPIGFGVNDRRLFINKNGPTILVPSRNKYATVARYTGNSFINGYASKENIARVNNSAAIVTSAEGAGTVVLFADDPTYRSYWLGTNRLFLNAVFFGNLLGGGFGGGGE
ncbi:MAG: peptidase M14 [Bacteroidetes bacterium]|nr:peptidase M14 [Bacteroidota bacterium]